MFRSNRKKSLIMRFISALWRYKWASVCLFLSAYLFASSGYIHAKAMLAQVLIADAWENTLTTGERHPPWSWADTYPVAKLNITDESYYVLAGATGRTLAFGPAHMSSTVLPGENGNSVITGHRDTHFSVLSSVQLGDIVVAQTEAGESSYQIDKIRIVNESQFDVTYSTDEAWLTLVTCYPFDDVSHNPALRYVVQAKLIASD